MVERSQRQAALGTGLENEVGIPDPSSKQITLQLIIQIYIYICILYIIYICIYVCMFIHLSFIYYFFLLIYLFIYLFICYIHLHIYIYTRKNGAMLPAEGTALKHSLSDAQSHGSLRIFIDGAKRAR